MAIIDIFNYKLTFFAKYNMLIYMKWRSENGNNLE